MLIFIIIKFVVILCSGYLLWYCIRTLRTRHISNVIRRRLATRETEGQIEELVRLALILRKDAPLVERVCQLCVTRGVQGHDIKELLSCFCRINNPTCETTEIFRYYSYLLKHELTASSG